MLQKYRIKICNITKMYGYGNFRMSGLKLLSFANEILFSLIQFSIFSLKIYKLEGVSKAQKRPQYKSKLATLVKYT